MANDRMLQHRSSVIQNPHSVLLEKVSGYLVLESSKSSIKGYSPCSPARYESVSVRVGPQSIHLRSGLKSAARIGLSQIVSKEQFVLSAGAGVSANRLVRYLCLIAEMEVYTLE
ncbi:hypothetical protein RRG08_024065 [Elysia crispata]|uniref:Uncharacterized protein n=1 Tax=Elysia crispata TaxID=231223 RepID=A0AAE0ZNY6_9GAST|nr:hypothetical protein RRG08_024065 [Elysia crispata]